jgi:hypothetical protein
MLFFHGTKYAMGEVIDGAFFKRVGMAAAFGATGRVAVL